MSNINYYNEIKNKLLDNEIYEVVKDYSKERNRVMIYYEVGKLLGEAGKHYGMGVIKDYSFKLTIELGVVLYIYSTHYKNTDLLFNTFLTYYIKNVTIFYNLLVELE